jgi:hypothetical protein
VAFKFAKEDFPIFQSERPNDSHSYGDCYLIPVLDQAIGDYSDDL